MPPEMTPKNTLETTEPVLLSGLIENVAQEKIRQYPSSQISFQSIISDKAQFAFAGLPPASIAQSILLLIDNALSAMSGRGTVKLKLDANADKVIIAIQDNGRGMNFEKLDQMLNRDNYNQSATPDTEFGMPQVWSLLEQCKGVLNVDTKLGVGTSVEMTFPRVDMPNWIATGIDLTASSVIIVLDQSSAVHEQWNKRFDIYQHLYPELRMQYFNDVQQALAYVRGLTPQEKSRLVLLSEYAPSTALPDTPSNPAWLFESGEIVNATLVTRDFMSADTQRAAAQYAIKILPTHMIPIIPINFGA